MEGKKPQSAFTLIELMIVVAIIGIIATMAISAYQTYTTRSIVGGELLPQLKKVANDVTEYYSVNGSINGFCQSVCVNDCGSQGVTIHNGTEYMSKMRCWPTTMTNSPFHFAAVMHPDKAPSDAPAEPKVVMFPTISNGNLEWNCGYHTGTNERIPEKYLPANCRSNYVTSTVTVHVDGVDVTSDSLMIE